MRRATPSDSGIYRIAEAPRSTSHGEKESHGRSIEPALGNAMKNGTSVRVSGALLFFIFIALVTSCLRTTWSRAFSSHKKADNADMASDAQAPLCGQPSDGKVHLPPDWTSFVPPAKGQSYVDPVFGCPVKRLTDSGKEETLPDGKHPSFMHYYSTLSPMNASDTMLMISSDTGAWRVKDTNGNFVVAADKMPAMNNGHPVWDASDGSVFYYALGKALHEGRIKGNSIKNRSLYTFKEYQGIGSPDAADLSQDGDHIALVGQKSNGTLDVFVWSLSKQVKTSVYTTICKVNEWDVTQTPQPACIHKLVLTPNNLLVIAFAKDGTDSEQGHRLWDGSKLTHLQDFTNHLDTGYDLKGNPVFIEVGRTSTLAGLSNPCPSGWGLDVRQLNGVSSASCLLDKLPGWHVSYRGGPSQPWAAISFFDKRNPGPELFRSSRGFQEPSPDNWELYEDEILLARIDGGAIYRLAHARSRSAENYGAEPHAAISRDGKYVIFSSNMAYPNGCPGSMHVANECTDVYLIKMH